ncbi:beta-phosphoglucomutase [Mycoplasma sp. OR1901]|uniref:beta-phosphoglucomutase n=1 Tax=Mycoplasma sp. OR1901 TaxID=2742195 RepID=UPI00158424B4|nr:beta-phosphoglucomutase [Mycoplasma sp. OR1901]QKT05700.1 beta-phosphoglucomutase [Mycoplasma sp. OR1901]
MTKIKGFVFDLDGVITDTAVLHFKAWREIVKEFDIDYTNDDNEKLRGLPRLDTLKAIINMKKPELVLSEAEMIDVATRKNDLYKELLATEINKDSLLPGVGKFLNDAKEAGIKLSIASSSYNAPTILDKLGIKDMFDFIVYPGDVKNGKPAPDIFIQAAQGVNLSVDECIGFEDAPAGVQGIKDANMYAVAITHGSSEDFSKADTVYKSTSELDFQTIVNLK